MSEVQLYACKNYATLEINPKGKSSLWDLEVNINFICCDVICNLCLLLSQTVNRKWGTDNGCSCLEMQARSLSTGFNKIINKRKQSPTQAMSGSCVRQLGLSILHVNDCSQRFSTVYSHFHVFIFCLVEKTFLYLAHWYITGLIS